MVFRWVVVSILRRFMACHGRAARPGLKCTPPEWEILLQLLFCFHSTLILINQSLVCWNQNGCSESMSLVIIGGEEKLPLGFARPSTTSLPRSEYWMASHRKKPVILSLFKCLKGIVWYTFNLGRCWSQTAATAASALDWPTWAASPSCNFLHCCDLLQHD